MIATERTTFKLQASKIYQRISILVHLFALAIIWIYNLNYSASLIFSIILIAHFYWLNTHILLTKSKAICSITLDGQALTTIDKSGASHQYPCVYCVYQSQFLVIINFGKNSLIIFKDSLASHSLSQLNRLLNA
ncbi:MAG: hypothetical protein K0U08_01170 [Proteobacteria bacterium]|nr:hypothetical protein [Pseudomonadota bacterium]MCH9711292.1 hypothetical protein [Pseudomonadota bacterium]MCH9750197.1 hypothetical protein [Pseudomonadota bacterium]